MQQDAHESSRASDGEKPSVHPALLTMVSESVAGAMHPDRNEDSLIVDQRGGLAAVLDGVGGSTAGEIASQIAARMIQQGWKRVHQRLRQEHAVQAVPEAYERIDLHSTLLTLVEEAHNQIRAEGRQCLLDQTGQRTGTEDQATTIALAIFYRQPKEREYLVVYAWVGDSRIYLLRGEDPLIRLTRDDGWLTKLVGDQVLTEADAFRIDQATDPSQLSEAERSTFEKRHGISQALGDPQPPTIRIDQRMIVPGDRIILCTDGIHDNLTDKEIETVVRQATSATIARLLVEQAIERSRQENTIMMRAKPDDMSAIVITCSHEGEEFVWQHLSKS
jgi:serine/threonine protein phosphatase PrpC